MDTTIDNSKPVATEQRVAATPNTVATVDTKAAGPEKVETARAVPAADTAQKPALEQSAPNSALTTYKDYNSGRLIVRVFDRESGDVLIEFPPERAFRSAMEILEQTAARTRRSSDI